MSAEHPLPYAARERWLSLDGPWKMRLEPGDARRPIATPVAAPATAALRADVEAAQALGFNLAFRRAR